MVEPTPTVCCGCDGFKTNIVLIGIEGVLRILGVISVFAGKMGYAKYFEAPTGILSIIVLGLELYGTMKKKPGFIMVACGWRIFRIFIHVVVEILLALVWSETFEHFDIVQGKGSIVT